MAANCRLPKAALFVALAAVSFAAQSHAQGKYPDHPVKVVVGFAAGGGTDVAARVIAQKLSDATGQSFVVENRAGASGLIASEQVAKSPADGYTIMVGSQTTLAVAPALYRKIQLDPAKELSRTFEDVQGYDDIVMLRDIEVESHCEHHMAPFLGKAYVAYMPTNRVVGISKLAKVVEIYARRLQTQETMTQQIADAITDSLRPAGVAILIDAAHQCMTTRGVHHRHVSTITTQFTGVFKTDATLRQRFLDFVNKR